MDALEFIKECKRMCDSFKNCASCPLLTEDCDNFRNSEFVEKAVPVVEAWSAAHPRKTRQSVFLEQYPNAKCVDGVSVLCPIWIDTCFSCLIDGNNNVDCATCRHEFWMQEIE